VIAVDIPKLVCPPPLGGVWVVVGEVGIKIVQQYADGKMQKYIVMVQTAFFWPIIWFV
jgi:hypothetical protein